MVAAVGAILAVWYLSGATGFTTSFFPSMFGVLEETESRSATITQSEVRLEFSAFNGQIILQPTSSDTLTINIVKRGTEVGLENIEIEFSDQVDSNGVQAISLAAKRLNPMLLNAQEAVRLEATVPTDASYSLDLSTSNGRIEVGQLRGAELIGRTSNGRLTLGDIDFSRVAVHTSNGGVEGIIRSDDTDITTGNGGISLTIVGAGEYSLLTSYGSVEVNLQSDIPARVDAKTSAQTWVAEWIGVPILVAQSERGRLLAQTEGFDEVAARIDLVLRTSNGGIHITSMD